MKKLWQPADIIDLYALLHMDDQERNAGGHANLAQRDRNIYLHEILAKKQGSQAQDGQTQNNSPPFLVRQWLSARRRMIGKEPDSQPLPGVLLQETLLTSRWLLIVGGLLSGIFAAGAFLVYSGKAPLNVSAFFALFILLPFLFLLLQFVFFSLRLIQKRKLIPGGLSALTGRLLVRGMQRLQKKLQQSTSGKSRLENAAFIGKLSITLRHSPDQAALLLWPAFILLQWAAVGFNLGLLGTTLAKVFFSDIAFAWQSSLQLSPEIVASTVQWISLPWSWLPQACPDLAQIQGSQLIFKEGIAHMATEDLRAWWPFLCLSIFFYGLLPRLLLIVLGSEAEHRSITRLVDRIPDVKRIMRRMLQPQLETTRYTAAIVQKGAPKPKVSSSPVRPGPTVAPAKPAPVVPPLERPATEAPPKPAVVESPSNLAAPITRSKASAQVPTTTAAPAKDRPDLAPPPLERSAAETPPKSPVAAPPASPAASIARSESPAQVPTATAAPAKDQPDLATPPLERPTAEAPPKPPVVEPPGSPAAPVARSEAPAQVPTTTAAPVKDQPAPATPPLEQPAAEVSPEPLVVEPPGSPAAPIARFEAPAQVPTTTAAPAKDQPASATPPLERPAAEDPPKPAVAEPPTPPAAPIARFEWPAQVPITTTAPAKDRPDPAAPSLEQPAPAAPPEPSATATSISSATSIAHFESPAQVPTTTPLAVDQPDLAVSDSMSDEASLRSSLTEENNFSEDEWLIRDEKEKPSAEETSFFEDAWPQEPDAIPPEPADLEPAEDHCVHMASCSLTLIPDELLEECPDACQEELIGLLARHQTGSALRVQAYNLFIPESAPAALLAGLLQENKDQSVEQALFIQEAWQPPIREHESMIHALRDQLGPDADIVILLIGKPNPATILTPADPAQMKIWQQKMQALADPNLFVHPLLSTDKDQQ